MRKYNLKRILIIFIVILLLSGVFAVVSYADPLGNGKSKADDDNVFMHVSASGYLNKTLINTTVENSYSTRQILLTVNEKTYNDIIALILVILVIAVIIILILSTYQKNFKKQQMRSKLIDNQVLYIDVDNDYNINSISDLLSKRLNLENKNDLNQEFTVLSNLIKKSIILNKTSSKFDDIHGEIETNSGVYLYYSIIKKPASNTGYIIVFNDITDRKKLEELSTTDDMTGLFNRRHFDNIIGTQIYNVKRQQKFFVLAILDIDNFKAYNDTYLHQMGDLCLEKIGDVINKTFSRASDFSFRIGGEEFACIFSADAIDVAYYSIERLRGAIQNLGIIHKYNFPYGVITVSIGIRIVSFNEDIEAKDVFNEADIALYDAKKTGKNRIVLYGRKLFSESTNRR